MSRIVYRGEQHYFPLCGYDTLDKAAQALTDLDVQAWTWEHKLYIKRNPKCDG